MTRHRCLIYPDSVATYDPTAKSRWPIDNPSLIVYHTVCGCETIFVHTPIGIAKLVVPGSIDHIPAKGEKLPDTLHPQLRIYPSKKLRDAVKNANFVFERVDGPEAEMSIRRVVTDSLGREGMNVVKPGERFTVTGAGFSDSATEPLSAELTDSAKVAHAVEVASVKPDVVECVAPAGLAKGKAKLVIVQPLGPEPIYGRLTASRNVTVV